MSSSPAVTSAGYGLAPVEGPERPPVHRHAVRAAAGARARGAARAGSRCPSGTRGPQPLTGSSATSSRPRGLHLREHVGVAGEVRRSSSPARRKPIVSAVSRRSPRPPSCTAGTARTFTPLTGTRRPREARSRFVAPARVTSGATPRGTTTRTPVREEAERRQVEVVAMRVRDQDRVDRRSVELGVGRSADEVGEPRAAAPGRSGCGRRRARAASCCARARSARPASES